LFFIVASLYILGLTSVIYTLLTAAGVTGIVIGFAVKEIASNMIAGIILKINQPFKKGHYISVDGKHAGSVKKMTMQSTTLVSYEGIPTILPNITLLTTPVINYSSEPKRLVNIKVAISPRSSIKKALKILEDIAKKEGGRLEDEPMSAFVNDIKEYYVVINLRFWASRKDFWSTKRRTLLKIAQQFKKNKIELAIPLRKTVSEMYVPSKI
jgi:small conductance mechanosensitive channel